jgi:hypothetical protein|uniref:hypothetical protein n=1 Tax=Prosthecobacter sp. TaxID=1965333 RepID=UPI003782FF12
MKAIFPLLALLCLGTSVLAQDKAALKRISGVFEAIEKNFEYWPHHSITGENLEGGYAFEHHLWQSNDEPPLYRVESLSFDDHGQAKKQYFIQGNELLFVLDRTEMTPMQPKAVTSVVEKRLYFAEGALIRMLAKEGKFSAGKATDTATLKNKDLPLDEVQGAGELFSEHDRESQNIIAKINQISMEDAPADASQPASGPATSGDGWRLIQGSTSRDGQFALAWGLKGQSAPDAEADEDGALSVEPETEGLTNYIINLRTGALLGKTKGSHFGDKHTYNHYTNEVAWSAAETYVAQVCNGKWATFDANLYELNPDRTGLSKALDLLEPSKKAVFEHLDGGGFFKKFDKDSFTITLHDVNIAQRGATTVVLVEVSGQIPKSDQDGAWFDATVTFKLIPDDNGGPTKLQWSGTEVHPE